MNLENKTKWLITCTFFLWGIVASTTDIIIPIMKQTFELSYTQAMFIKSSFFMAYLVLAIPFGKLVDKTDYQSVIKLGLILIIAGCISISFATTYGGYLLFLFAFFIMASGVTCLQVSANPFMRLLGNQQQATQRLTFAQGFNSLGTTLGPIFASFCLYLFATLVNPEPLSANHAKAPYILVACIAVIILGMIVRNNYQVFEAERPKRLTSNHQKVKLPKALWLGAIGIFCYVGAEVSVTGFLVMLLTHIKGDEFDHTLTSQFMGIYWFGMMCGRFIGANRLKNIDASTLLTRVVLITIVIMITAILTPNHISIYLLLSLGLFKSVMFPSIFSVAIRDVKVGTGKASGILCMSIFGGAIIPVLQGAVADVVSLKSSFLIPIFCYFYILWFANCYRKDKTTI